MARNGSGGYSLPAGSTFSPNTVIESAKVNAALADLAADNNAARPIVAGGTGATSASAARTALGLAADAGNFGKQGASIASASTTDLSTATGDYVTITGTTTITSFGTATAGVERVVVFAGALTLTHNATSLILPGNANIVTAAGDVALLKSEGSGNWRCVNFQRQSDNWVDVASATTTDIGAAASQNVRITGTTTITGLGTVAAGTFRRMRFAGALTLTHNATSLILPGAANIVTVAGDVGEFISEGSGNWRCIDYTRGPNFIREAGVASLSGTSVDFLSIPSGVRRITISITDASLNSTSSVLVQLGTSSGVVATGYAGSYWFGSGGVTTANLSTGFIVLPLGAAASVGNAFITITRTTGNVWHLSSNGAFSSAALVTSCAGLISLAAVLDRVRITTVSGTDTFDNGSVNVFWEF